MNLRFLLLLQIFCIAPAFCADANAEWTQAQQLFQGGDYNRALPALLALDKAFPSNVKLHYMIGICYKNVGKASQAQRELAWVASYAQDVSLKQSASAALSELSADVAAIKTKAQETAKTAEKTDAGAAFNPLTAFAKGLPPSKNLVNDSVSSTVSEAYRKGWKPCTNSKCLNYSKSGWEKMTVKGHPPTDIWMNFGPISFSQWHIGDIIEASGGTYRDAGPCMTCMGTGWVKK